MEFNDWHKSTYSSGGGECIEQGVATSGVVGVRDTKDHSQGTLNLSPAAWSAFVSMAKGADLA